MQRHKRLVFASLTTLVALLLATSVAALQLTSAPNGNTVKVDGTSSLHDWSVASKVIKGSIDLPAKIDPQTPLANASWLAAKDPSPRLVATIPVRKLKSGESGMDDNMYEAFNTKKNPNITFTLDKIWAVKTISNDVVDARATGTLQMKGKSRPVTMDLRITRGSNGSLEFAGHHSLDMRKWGIDPPTAMLGMLKTGPKVKVTFHWVLVQN